MAKDTPISQAVKPTMTHIEARKDTTWWTKPAGGTTPSALLTRFT